MNQLNNLIDIEDGEFDIRELTEDELLAVSGAAANARNVG
ncbi:hypothetical protein FBX98_101163 [Burkholderia sp. SJZ115]|nr:hypothetical protein FB600_101163 [Burkholderia sp. SJZ089]TWD08798.1 hypothetical protein FBX98_101163 [Burkholderia sp. SJZ115]TWD11933.1 hypothetical protein FB601_101164 [Burkholderia sp. SJZ091]